MKSVSTMEVSDTEVKSVDEGSQPRFVDPPALKSESRDVVHQDILLALKGLEFGEVTITIREGRIVKIERVERRRQLLSKRAE